MGLPLKKLFLEGFEFCFVSCSLILCYWFCKPAQWCRKWSIYFAVSRPGFISLVKLIYKFFLKRAIHRCLVGLIVNFSLIVKIYLGAKNCVINIQAISWTSVKQVMHRFIFFFKKVIKHFLITRE